MAFERQGGFRPRNGGSGGSGGGFGAPREMHEAVCSSCGQQTKVPFKPQEGRPVYCRDCFMKQREQRQ